MILTLNDKIDQYDKIYLLITQKVKHQVRTLIFQHFETHNGKREKGRGEHKKKKC